MNIVPQELLTWALAALFTVGFALFVTLLVLQRRHAKRIEFPTAADLGGTCLQAYARELLTLLRAEVKDNGASVYRAAYGHEWNVWLPATGRLTLHDWCVERGMPQIQRELLIGGAA